MLLTAAFARQQFKIEIVKRFGDPVLLPEATL